jgi:hypothetical protein
MSTSPIIIKLKYWYPYFMEFLSNSWMMIFINLRTSGSSTGNWFWWLVIFAITLNSLCIPLGMTIREGQFRHTSAKIEFPHHIFRSPHHPKPITRCIFDKIYLIYTKSNLHVGYITVIRCS